MRGRGFVAAAAALGAAAFVLSGCVSTPNTAVAARADALMRDLSGRALFQGAVVLSRGGRVEYAAGFGFADIERQQPFTPDTPTDGASVAKTFTAAALLMLANEGRVDLDAPVRSVLPEYPHATTRLRHLLAHSAGLPDYAWLDARAAASDVRTNTRHLALVARDAPTPAFAPGTQFAYDNVAYDVAAMVLTRITDSNYADVVAERFSKPLGLAAFVRPARFADWQGPRTRGYRRTAAGWRDHDALDGEGFHGAANLYLSARDLCRWAEGYSRVVAADARRAAVTPARLDDGRATGITLGSWYVSADHRQRYYTGHHNGFHNFVYADEARGLAIAWVANDAPPAWLQPALARALIAIAEGREAEALVPPAASAAPAHFDGNYRVPRVGELTIRRQGQGLQVRLGGVDYATFAVARGVHYAPGLDAYLRFAVAPDGGALLSWDSVFVVAAGVLRQGPR